MSAEAAAKDDRAAAVALAIQPTAPWRVREVKALPGDRPFVRFADGLTGTVDLSAVIAAPDAEVFARLRDRNLFEQVSVQMGVTCGLASWIWPLTRCLQRSSGMGNGRLCLSDWARRSPHTERQRAGRTVGRKSVTQMNAKCRK
jgi:hypothetical protein